MTNDLGKYQWQSYIQVGLAVVGDDVSVVVDPVLAVRQERNRRGAGQQVVPSSSIKSALSAQPCPAMMSRRIKVSNRGVLPTPVLPMTSAYYTRLTYSDGL
jgi:hypothetical protein